MERRSLTEFITLIEFEPQLQQLIVEGETDKLLFERFLLKNRVSECAVIEVDSIDFQELYEASPEIRRNNKNKLIKLSTELTSQLANENPNICCILDKDFDEITNGLIDNAYVLYTDYTDIEMYLYNPETIKLFIKNSVRRFPVEPSDILNRLTPILTEKFLIRLSLALLNNPVGRIVDLGNSVRVIRQTCSIEFDSEDHLRKNLNGNQLIRHFSTYLTLIDEKRQAFVDDRRNYIRGHDFIHLFFLYVDRIKNTIRMTEETMERLLFQSIDYSELLEYPLFQRLLEKYNAN